MFATCLHPEIARRALCLFFSAIIVASSLTLGVVGVQSIERAAVAAAGVRA